MTFLILVGVIVVALIAFYAWRTGSYYSKILCKPHYVEVINWLHCVLKLGEVDEPRFEDNTAFKTSGQCALTFTREIAAKDTIHIAMSQTTRPTDHAVCNRLAFLICEALKPDVSMRDFYYTEGRVHHLVLKKEAGSDWLLNPTDAVVASMKSYEPLPLRFQESEESP